MNNLVLDELDKPRSFREAAEILGIAYYKIQRAVKAGILPSYSLFNSRRYVTLRDILRVMSASK